MGLDDGIKIQVWKLKFQFEIEAMIWTIILSNIKKITNNLNTVQNFSPYQNPTKPYQMGLKWYTHVVGPKM